MGPSVTPQRLLGCSTIIYVELEFPSGFPMTAQASLPQGHPAHPLGAAGLCTVAAAVSCQLGCHSYDDDNTHCLRMPYPTL